MHKCKIGQKINSNRGLEHSRITYGRLRAASLYSTWRLLGKILHSINRYRRSRICCYCLFKVILSWRYRNFALNLNSLHWKSGEDVQHACASSQFIVWMNEVIYNFIGAAEPTAKWSWVQFHIYGWASGIVFYLLPCMFGSPGGYWMKFGNGDCSIDGKLSGSRLNRPRSRFTIRDHRN